MEAIKAAYTDESCCQGSKTNMALKTLPFVLLGTFGGPIGWALGVVVLAASRLPEFQEREVRHLQLHLAYGMVAGAFLRLAIAVVQRQVSTNSIANLIAQGGIWGITAVWLKRDLDASRPRAPVAIPPAGATFPTGRTKITIINGVPTRVPA